MSPYGARKEYVLQPQSREDRLFTAACAAMTGMLANPDVDPRSISDEGINSLYFLAQCHAERLIDELKPAAKREGGEKL